MSLVERLKGVGWFVNKTRRRYVILLPSAAPASRAPFAGAISLQERNSSLAPCQTLASGSQIGMRSVGHVVRRPRSGGAAGADARGGPRAEDKMAEFERQVEELSGRVSSLMQEKLSLETRNSLLERVVQLKQETDSDRVRCLMYPRP